MKYEAACPARQSLTVGEAREALEESSISSEADTLLADGVELSTSFTIGDAVEKAAQDLRDFVKSQLPCAEVTLASATLTIECSCITPGPTSTTARSPSRVTPT